MMCRYLRDFCGVLGLIWVAMACSCANSNVSNVAEFVQTECVEDALCSHDGLGGDVSVFSEPSSVYDSGEPSEVWGDTSFRETESTTDTIPSVPGLIPEACFELPNYYKRIACISPYVAAIVKESSARDAFCRVAGLLREGKIQDCHLLAHVIGEANLEKYQGDAAQALANCPLDCIQGCIHGVMEKLVGRLQEQGQATPSVLLSLCDSLQRDPVAFRQCVHGLGHGLLAHGFLSLQQALQLCEKSPSVEFTDACVSGVLMENFDRYSLLGEEELKALLPSLCRSVLQDARWFVMCVGAIGEGLMFYTGYDLNKSQGLCETLRALYQEEAVRVCREAALEEGKNRDSNQKSSLDCSRP